MHVSYYVYTGSFKWTMQVRSYTCYIALKWRAKCCVIIATTYLNTPHHNATHTV